MPPEELRFEALGCRCHLLGCGLPAGSLEEAVSRVESAGARLSRFRPDSELSRFNAAAGRWVAVGPELEELLRLALGAWAASGGLVHAGVLDRMLAIGYTRPLAAGPTPAGALEAESLPPLPELLEVAPGAARLRPGFGVDLGGLAKGWLADRLASRLAGECVVNLGGDLYARGGGPDGEGWPVRLGGVTLLLRDAGAATSSTRRRRWSDAGRELHHLVDPRTGLPAAGDLSEVSVVAASAAEAEIAAKTALLLGRERAPAYLAAAALAWWLA